MTHGIHHVTSITADVQANVDFYAGFLGLRLVKRTGGFEDGEQLHLFYGDAAGSPGTLLSFLVWEGAGRGRTGLGQVSEVALAVPPDSIGDWLTRALGARVAVEGPRHEFGAPVLRLRDPDGLVVKLVGIAAEAPAPLAGEGAITRIHGVTLLSETAEETAAFITRFGYVETLREGPFIRLSSGLDVVDVRQSAGFVPSIPGAGVPDHVALRAVDVDAVRQMRLDLQGHGPTSVHDRTYFLSLYVREPGETLIEYATDAPGMTVDEPLEHLGETLFLPPGELARADDLRVMLPQFAMPGEPRWPQRDLPFVHRFHRPGGAGAEAGETLVLLHGSGGSETQLMAMAHRARPDAVLLGLRGRATEEGSNRWFRRTGMERYDQDDIAFEAATLVETLPHAARGYGLVAEELVFLGYSNGANLLGAALQLHPGLMRRVVLLRAMQVLEAPPALPPGALDGVRVLMLDGARDHYALGAPALADALRAAGAEVTVNRLDHGHDLTAEDEAAINAWLGTPAAV